jgi:hypothetical protein
MLPHYLQSFFVLSISFRCQKAWRKAKANPAAVARNKSSKKGHLLTHSLRNMDKNHFICRKRHKLSKRLWKIYSTGKELFL